MSETRQRRVSTPPRRLSFSHTSSTDYGNNIACQNLANFLGIAFQGFPLELSSYVENHPMLDKLLSLVRTSMMYSGTLTAPMISVIDLGLRFFVAEVIKITNNDKSGFTDKVPTEAEMAEISNLQLKVIELTRKNDTLEDMQSEHVGEVKDLQKQIDSLYNENYQLKNDLQSMSINSSSILLQEGHRHELLTDQIGDLEQKIKIQQDKYSSLENRLNMANEEIEENKHTINSLKVKLEERKEKQNRLSTQVRILQGQLEESEIQRQKLSIDLQAANSKVSSIHLPVPDIEYLRIENERLSSQVAELSFTNKELTTELDLKSQISFTQSSIIEDQSLASELDEMKEKNKKLEKKLESTNKLKYDYDEMVKQNNLLQDKNTQNNTLIEQVAQKLNCARKDILPKINEIQTKKDKSDQGSAQRLIGIADSLARFLINLANDPSPNLSFDQSSLSNDVKIRQQITKDISKIRQSISECGNDRLSIPELNLFISYFGTDAKASATIARMDSGEFAALAGLSAAVTLQRKTTQSLLDDLRPLRRAIPARAPDRLVGKELSRAIGPSLDALAQAALTARSIGGVRGAGKSDAQVVLEFVDVASKLMHELDTDTRNALKYRGPLSGLPTAIQRSLDSSKNNISSAVSIRDTEIERLKRKIETLESEFNRKFNSEKERSADLRRANQELQHQLELSRSELDSANESMIISEDQREELEKSFAVFHQNHSDAEQRVRLFREDNDRLRGLLEERAIAAQKRTAAAVEREKLRGVADLERERERYEDEMRDLRGQLAEKTGRLTAEKRRYREYAAEAEESLRRQREAIEKLSAQNRELAARLQVRKPSDC